MCVVADAWHGLSGGKSKSPPVLFFEVSEPPKTSNKNQKQTNNLQRNNALAVRPESGLRRAATGLDSQKKPYWFPNAEQKCYDSIIFASSTNWEGSHESRNPCAICPARLKRDSKRESVHGAGWHSFSLRLEGRGGQRGSPLQSAV